MGRISTSGSGTGLALSKLLRPLVVDSDAEAEGRHRGKPGLPPQNARARRRGCASGRVPFADMRGPCL